MVVPLRSGAGTRLKILDALAAGKAIVTTTVGVEGLDLQDGRHLLIQNDPAAFAAAIVELLGDPGLAGRLGEAGRMVVGSRYAWPHVAAPLLALYRELGVGTRG